MKRWKRKYGWLKAGIFVLILYVGSASNLVCLVQPSYVPLNANSLRGSGHIYLVPLAGFPDTTMERLKAFYRDKYGLNISILPTLSVPRQALNEGREQFVAEHLIRQLEEMASKLNLAPDSTVIGLTDLDMYIDQYNWRYAFAYRTDQFAVVSAARMGYPFMEVWPISAEWQETRLRKMVTKEIGVTYYHLPLSTHCKSPLFGKIGGPQELDFMGEEL